MNPMNHSSSCAASCRRIAADSVADFLRDRAQGNPFCPGDGTALVESGRISVESGRCEIASAQVSARFRSGHGSGRGDEPDRSVACARTTHSEGGERRRRTFTTSVLGSVYRSRSRSAQSRLSRPHDEPARTARGRCYSFICDHAGRRISAHGGHQRRELPTGAKGTRRIRVELAVLSAPGQTLSAAETGTGDRLPRESGEAALRDHANEEALEFFESALSMQLRNSLIVTARVVAQAMRRERTTTWPVEQSPRGVREALLLSEPAAETKPALVFAT